MPGRGQPEQSSISPIPWLCQDDGGNGACLQIAMAGFQCRKDADNSSLLIAFSFALTSDFCGCLILYIYCSMYIVDAAGKSYQSEPHRAKSGAQ